MATTGQFYWPSVGSSVAAYGQFFMAAYIRAAQNLANRHLIELVLTSELPGFVPQVFTPEPFDDEQPDQQAHQHLIPYPSPDASPQSAASPDPVEEPAHQPAAATEEVPAGALVGNRTQKAIRTEAPSSDEDGPAEHVLDAAPGDHEAATVPEKSPTRPNRRTLILIGSAAAGFLLVIVLVLWQTVGGDSTSSASAPEPEAPSVEDQADWATSLTAPTSADEALDEVYGHQLWGLPAAEAQTLSWFSAGVVSVYDSELRLYDTLTGDEIATVELDEPIQWTVEHVIAGSPAVGFRTGDEFIAIDAEGEVQSWPLSEDATVAVTGQIPILTEDETHYALVFGEEDPVELTGNPELITPAADVEHLIQVAPGSPRVVLIPFESEESEQDLEAADIRLIAPTPEAVFSRHLSVGHGQSLALWEVEGESYLGVHPLDAGEDEAPAAAFVPAPKEITGWEIARGMGLALVGPYAFDLSTGALASYAGENTTFSAGLGPAAVTETSDGRRFTVENETYTEQKRIIGYTGDGTIVIREADGSVTVLGQSTGGIS
ncbi:hypothetical protein GCM10011359_30590 [Nesterenkonia alkaliphila]|nr:hypothetical protein GCM10011359_30590 [Nesterenkonia alkaliphila]